MNRILVFMMLIPLVYGAFNGTLTETVAACFDGANSAVLLVLSFAGVMCLWTGILRIAENAGADRIVACLLRPVIRFLFPRLDKDSKAVKYITLNITANVLGLGNGATPMGIKAMEELDREKPEVATDEMCMFTVLNTAAFQLIPTSVIALRAAEEAEFGVIVPIWITSLCSLTVAVLCVKLMCLILRKKAK